MKSVFLSYAKEDLNIALKLKDGLRRQGIDVWIDEEKLLPGENWKRAISRAIKKNSYFIVLLSTRSVNKRGFVQKELKEALKVLEEVPEKDIFIIPVRLENCSLSNQVLNELNWVDLFPSYELGFSKLMRIFDVSTQPVGDSKSFQVSPTALNLLPEEVCLYQLGICLFELHYFSSAHSMSIPNEYSDTTATFRDKFEQEALKYCTLYKRLGFPAPPDFSYGNYDEGELKIHLTESLSLAPLRWRRAYGVGFDVGHAALGAIPLFLAFAKVKANPSEEVQLMLKLGIDYIERAENTWVSLFGTQKSNGLSKLKEIFNALKFSQSAIEMEEAVGPVMNAVSEIGGEMETICSKENK